MPNVFSIGISALVTSQRQLATVSHNIANVNTDGYSRQRVEQTQFPAQKLSSGFIGNGVRIAEITRIADEFLIGQLQSATASEAKAASLATLAGELDSILGDGSINSSIESFFAAIHDANDDPASISSREVLLNTAQTFAARYSDLDQRLSGISRDIDVGLGVAVQRINDLSSSIAAANVQIIRSLGSAGGEPPNDLLDQRDKLVTELAELTGVSTLTQENGALNVFIGNGQAVVTDVSSIPLTLVANPLDGTRMEIATTTGGAPSIISQALDDGELGAALVFRDQTLTSARNELGRVAASLAVAMNEQHQQGFTLDDAFGGDFFNIGAPQVNASASNTGTISVALDTTNIGALTAADYRLDHDGSDFTLTNLTNGSAQILSGAGPFNVDGLTISVASAPASGDSYLLLPTRSIARDMTVAVSDTRGFALARPHRTSESINNIGSANVSSAEVLDRNDANLLTPVQLVFSDPPTSFQVNGVGALIPYMEGADIDINGWRIKITGVPEPGDTFSVAPNTGAAGDNGNGLELSDLQLSKLLDNGTRTFQETYSQLIGAVGSTAAEAQFRRDAMAVLRENAQASRDARSAVSLDEEAAQLLRFQQAYTAAAEVISIANETFAALLAAVRN